MQTGQLDQRIILYRPTFTIDGTGASIPGTPEELRQIWAEVKYLNGYELEVAMQRWTEVKYRITIRRQPGLTIESTDYVEWNGKTLDIREPEGPGTREPFWLIFAKDHEV